MAKERQQGFQFAFPVRFRDPWRDGHGSILDPGSFQFFVRAHGHFAAFA
jgi:hypothetical protein